MTEQKLREKIAQYIAKEMRRSQTPAYSLSATEQAYGIVMLIKEAGYTNETDAISYTQGVLDGRKGYVKLAEDQSPPRFSFSVEEPNMRFGYQLAVEEMLKAGWRKVKLGEQDDGRGENK